MYRIGKEEIEAVTRVIENGNLFKINNGLQEVHHCEEEMKELLGVDYAILMTSGKAAIISGLVGLGIGPGDEVIIPAYTYIATAIAVTAVGAIPVIAEVDKTLTLDVKDVERKISKHTKAIIPVHIQGLPSNMDGLKALAEKHDLKIIEDACQSVGGSYKGKRLGSIGDVGAYSFNFFKIISSGEGGALFTNDKKVFERALIYHDSSAVAYFGNQLENNDENLFCGNEYRANEIQGAILREQLKKLDGILFDLRKNRKAIMDAVNDRAQFIDSNDNEGDCGTSVAFFFENEEMARKFATSEGIGGTLPIDTGKHVYTNWTPVLEKRGALNQVLNPYNLPENKNLNHSYSLDMCPKTLEYLKRTVFVPVNPDWTEEALNKKISDIKNALKK